MNRNADAQLERALGVRQLSASIFNYTVGSGIFALPAVAVANLGSAAPLAFLVCMVIMGLVLLCFAEAGNRVAMTGGPYAYVEVALGPFVGFIAGVMLLLTGTIAGGAVANLFARSATALLPAAPDWFSPLVIVAVIVLFVFTNIRGVRNSARVIEGITLAKIVPLIGFVIVGMFFVNFDNFSWRATPSVSQVMATAGIVIFAFSGIESALAPSGEVKNPSRTVPIASFAALGAATLLYLLIQGVALGIQGLALADDRVTPLASAAQTFAGPVGKTIMIAGATISMLGYLSANVLAGPRSWFALARDGYLPKALSAVHERTHAPHVAIFVYGIVIGALALTGTFEQLAIFANLTSFVLYFLCAIAVWVLRKRDVRGDGPPFLIPGGPIVPIAAALANVWLIYATAGQRDLLGMAAVIVVATALYALRSVRKR